MSTIGSVDRLVAAIQAQLSTRAPAPAGAGVTVTAPGRTARPAAGKTRSGRYAQENLGGLIELRIAQIDRDDPQRGRKAFRVFLEAVLLSHLGEALVGDPKFSLLVDDVQSALEADPACAAMVASAIDQLLDPAAGQAGARSE